MGFWQAVGDVLELPGWNLVTEQCGRGNMRDLDRREVAWASTSAAFFPDHRDVVVGSPHPLIRGSLGVSFHQDLDSLADHASVFQ